MRSALRSRISLLARLRHDVVAVCAVLAVLVSSQALGEWHLVRQHHAVCAAHGEWVADEHGHTDEARPAAAEDGAAFKVLLPEGTHHHCVVASTLHSASRPAVVRGLEVRLAPLSEPRACEALAPERAIAILHLAPKLSPPRS